MYMSYVGNCYIIYITIDILITRQRIFYLVHYVSVSIKLYTTITFMYSDESTYKKYIYIYINEFKRFRSRFKIDFVLLVLLL